VGEPFPTLTLKGLRGGTMDISAYTGKLVVLNVWAAWCAPCVEEMPSLDRLSQALDKDRFVVIGLTVDDDPFLTEEFLRKMPVTFANFVDPKRAIVEGVLGTKAFPETFIIGPQGILVQRIPGGQEWDAPNVRALLEQIYKERTAPVRNSRATRTPRFS